MHRFGCFSSSTRNHSSLALSGRLTVAPSTATGGGGVPPRQRSPALAVSLQPAPLFRHNQVAYHWQAVIRRNKVDPKTGKRTFQDWDDVIMGFQRPTLSTTGQPLLDRYASIERHIKPKQIRREINAAKVYRRSVKRVDDLVSYIQFMRTANDIDKEDEQNGKK